MTPSPLTFEQSWMQSRPSVQAATAKFLTQMLVPGGLGVTIITGDDEIAAIMKAMGFAWPAKKKKGETDKS